MKLYSTLLILLFSISIAFSQKTANLTITSNKDIPEGYYLNIQNKNYGFNPDKTIHELELSVDHPEYALLISPKGKYYLFWYEEGDTALYFEQGLFKNKLKVNGSDSHIIFENLRNAVDFESFRQVFESNKNSIVALNYIDSNFKFNNYSKDQVREIYQMISEENLQLTPRFNAYINTLDKEKLVKNKKFIDFVGYGQDGNAFNTADYRGQYLLIDIAATWCGPCWGAFPYMIEGLKKYKNIQYITLNEDSDTDGWGARAKKRNLEINWPVLWEVESGKRELLLQYQIDSYPTYILVDPKGVVVERWNFSNEKVFNLKLKKHLD